jgi:hypothetical protein
VTGRLVALAVLAAATFAALGAGTGAWLGWRDVPPTPVENVDGLAAVVAPGAVLETVDHVAWSSGWVGGGPGTAGILPVLFRGEFPTAFEEAVVRTGAGTGAVLDAAAGRLAAEGWDADRAAGGVEATRDGLQLLLRKTEIPGDVGGGADVQTVTLTLQPHEPDRVLTLALTGAAAGAVLGAAVTLLLGRRSSAVRAAVFAVCVVLSGVTAIGLLGLFLRLTGFRLSPDHAERNGVIAGSMVLSLMMTAGIALALAGVAVAVGQGRSPAKPPAR